MDESFYLTLLSNSSMSYFPENTTANFFTKLPKTIKLEGEWVVGLVECHYPCSMLNVQDHENVVYITKKVYLPDSKTNYTNVEYKSHIPATNYENISNFLNAFNVNPLIKGKVKFQHDEISRLIAVTTMTSNITRITATPKLSLQLGFEPNTNFVRHNIGKYPINLHLGLPSQLFIYSDIVHPQIIGDVMSSLLRIIPLDPTKYIYGAYKINVFSPAHYLPVLRREFDVIEIDIRTSIGERVPFQFGTSCIKLHFKKVSS